MPSDYENGLKKIIDLSVQTEKMTSGILKSAVQEFLSGSAEKSGQMTLGFSESLTYHLLVLCKKIMLITKARVRFSL